MLAPVFTPAHNAFIFFVIQHSYIHRLVCLSQGPAGKDGLPGHPGQRGETVSEPVWVNSPTTFFWSQLYDCSSFCLKHTGIPRQDWPTWSSRRGWPSGESQPLTISLCWYLTFINGWLTDCCFRCITHIDSIFSQTQNSPLGVEI